MKIMDTMDTTNTIDTLDILCMDNNYINNILSNVLILDNKIYIDRILLFYC